VHEEGQLHAPAVFGTLEAARRDLDQAGAEEGQREDFGVAEIGVRNVAGDNS
jgi:hypothetical protein